MNEVIVSDIDTDVAVASRWPEEQQIPRA